MPTPIYLVKVGMSMTEGAVEEWVIPDGGTVSKGELLYRLETEKVNLDVDAEADGIVKHLIAEGVTMEPGDVIGYIYAAGEEIPDALPGADDAPAAAVAEQSATVAVLPGATETVEAVGGRLRASPIAKRLAAERGIELEALTGTGPMGRIVEADVLAAEPIAIGETGGRTSPMARKVARELGVDLNTVTGTGPGGRITKADVEAAAASAAAQPVSTAAQPAAVAATPSVVQPLRSAETVPLKGMRKTIATRMHDSLQSMAQLTMDMDVVMDDAVKLRGQLVEEWAEDGIRVTYTDLVIKAVARALEKHPLMNASMTDTEIIRHGVINVGMAVALPEGLIVPVVQNANLLNISALARETARLAAAARDGSLSLDDLQGGTFTVTALGMFGVDSFTPIINSPEAGILGVNRIRDDVAWDGDTPIRQQRMKLSLTWDHRVLDGAPAAQFLAAVRELLESPFRLLL